jgi:hypothetical protein
MNWRAEIITRNLQTLEGAHHLCPDTREFLSHIKDIGAENMTREDFNRLQEITEKLEVNRSLKQYLKRTRTGMVDTGCAMPIKNGR